MGREDRGREDLCEQQEIELIFPLSNVSQEAQSLSWSIMQYNALSEERETGATFGTHVYAPRLHL